MYNCKRGLEGNISDLFTKILSIIVREELLERFLYWRREKVVVLYSQINVYTMTLVVVFIFPSEGLHHEREKIVLFLLSEAVKILDSYHKSYWLSFYEVFLSPSEGLHHELSELLQNSG